jgi:iron complex transport system substrate-binding protein
VTGRQPARFAVLALLLAAVIAGAPARVAGAPAPAAAAPAPVRVATLLPYVARALDGIGSARVVAAVARPGERLPDGVLDLGNPHSPSFERLAEARPDLVVGDRRIHGPLADKLGRGGAEVLMVDAESVAATFDGLLRVGERVGADDEMRRRVAAARAEIASLRRAEPVSALPLFGAPGSFLAITGSTWLGDLLADLGFRNLAAEAAGREAFPGYVEISDELLATMRPELVLLVAHGAPEAVAEAAEQRAAGGGVWGALAGRLRVLDPDLFAANPGLRMAEAARRLAELAADVRAESAPAKPARTENARAEGAASRPAPAAGARAEDARAKPGHTEDPRSR